ncbi:MAG: TlpA family protein disulfide reductase [Bacteroidota bacterium]
MTFKTLVFSVTVIIFTSLGYAQSYKSLKKGYWRASLELNAQTGLPFTLEISGTSKTPKFIIHNAEEKIELTRLKIVNDSIQVDFPNFHSFLRFAVKGKGEIAGSWTNLNKGDNYKIPFTADFAFKNKKGMDAVSSNYFPNDLSGRWKTTFSPDSPDEEYAIGVFKSTGYQVTGTFLTETGDYRFLEGQSFGKYFHLSCFDGSHAFYFTATFENDSLTGNFYSGKHYQTNWMAVKDENFVLRNPDSVTYLVKKDPFTFKLKDLEGKEFVYPNDRYKDKVTIIQIMGTWCPNCLDETRFLKEMYAKYHPDGLEVISVGYETPVSFEEQVKKIRLLQTRLDLDFTFLVGGQANKALASEHFSMLNQVVSYPTAIFINKKGEVVKIHTGFNGPGTGEVYTTFKQETEEFIRSLLKP